MTGRVKAFRLLSQRTRLAALLESADARFSDSVRVFSWTTTLFSGPELFDDDVTGTFAVTAHVAVVDVGRVLGWDTWLWSPGLRLITLSLATMMFSEFLPGSLWWLKHVGVERQKWKGMAAKTRRERERERERERHVGWEGWVCGRGDRDPRTQWPRDWLVLRYHSFSFRQLHVGQQTEQRSGLEIDPPWPLTAGRGTWWHSLKPEKDNLRGDSMIASAEADTSTTPRGCAQLYPSSLVTFAVTYQF